MTPYIFTILVVSLGSLAFDYSKLYKFRNIAFWIAIAYILLFVSFRSIGTANLDFEAYHRTYEALGSSARYTKGGAHITGAFVWLSSIGHFFKLKAAFITVAMGILSVVPVAYIIQKYSPRLFISLAVWLPYIFTLNMHASRGSVAVAFGFLSVILLFKKRYFSSSLCFAVAVSFHVTSVFLLVVFAACLPARVILIATLAALFVKLSFMLKVIAPIFSLVGLSNVSWMITNYSSSLDYGYSMSFYDPRLVLAILMSYIIYRYQLKQIINFLCPYLRFSCWAFYFLSAFLI